MTLTAHTRLVRFTHAEYARRRPSGENAGARLMSGPLVFVSRRGTPLPTGMRYRAHQPFFTTSSLKLGRATTHRRSGDHAIVADSPPATRKSESFRSPLPPGRTEWSMVPPSEWSRMNAI